MVTASAVAGYITAPHGTGGESGRREVLEKGTSVRVAAQPAPTESKVQIMEGFPTSIEGELLFVPKDNLNTDGIYGKEFTYREDLSPEEMGTKAMLNYDPNFQDLARAGDILIGGFNFGSGSSREQAATALKFRGLKMVIAGSYSQTYKRNAFNNGYILIESPELVEDLKREFAGDKSLTIRTGKTAAVDFVAGKITCGEKTYGFNPLGEIAQELIVMGGFEAVIRAQLGAA